MTVYIKKLTLAVIVCALLFIGVTDTRADILVLKNGRSIEGIIIRQEGNDISLDVGFGVVTFRQEEVEQIHKSNPREETLLRDKWAQEKIEREKARKKIEKEIEALPKQVNVDKVMGHVVVSALLNDKIKATLLLDTGASLIVLSRRIVKELGYDLTKEQGVGELVLADGRKIKTTYIILKSVKIQDTIAKDVEAAVMPFDTKNDDLKDGVLGMSFLKRFNFKINYDEGKLTMEKTK